MATRKVMLYTRFERFWHWTQPALILTMLVTGFEIHAFYELFGFERAVSLHTTAAWVLMGLWVFGSTVYRVFYVGVPEAEIMGVVGALALATNLASVLLLVSYKDGDANVRSVWLCSRNDAIGNVAVMFAALGVWGTATGWPDLIVAAIMASLFLSSAFQIVRQALAERREFNSHNHAEV